MENEFAPDLITLTDQDGVEESFEIIDELVIDDEQYYALLPYYDSPEEQLEDSGEFIILKAVDIDGEDMLSTINDEAEYERIGAMFTEHIEKLLEEYDEEE